MLRTTLTALSLSTLTLAACAADPDDVLQNLPAGVQIATVDFGAGPKEVAYTVDETGMAIMDGDIILGPADVVASGTLVFRPVDEPLDLPDGAIASAIAHLGSWPGGEIPYEIDPVLEIDYDKDGDVVATAVEAAIDYWNDNTIVKLVPFDPAVHFHRVKFTGAIKGMGTGEGQSAIGYQPGPAPQLIRLGVNVSTSTVRHEIGHTVGLFHEQSRVDRDDHISINWDNVRSSKVGNFWTYVVSGAVGMDYGPYDTSSLMHYRWNTFAIDDAVPTIVLDGCSLTDSSAACRPTPSSGLTTIDKRGVTRLITGNSQPKFRIRNESENKCLRPSSGSTAAGANVILSSCTNSASRRWYFFTQPGQTTGMLINENSRLCLDKNSSNRLVQQPCNGSSSQRFRFTSSGWFGGDYLKRGSRCATRSTSSSQPFLSTSCSNVASKRWFRDYL